MDRIGCGPGHFNGAQAIGRKVKPGAGFPKCPWEILRCARLRSGGRARGGPLDAAIRKVAQGRNRRRRTKMEPAAGRWDARASGPGRVLTGLMRKINRAIPCQNIGAAEAIGAVAGAEGR